MSDRPARVPFEPRSAANCLDLAVMYCGRELSTLLTLWACAAVPGCALVYVLTYYYEFDLRLALLVIYVATAVLGGWLLAAVTPGVFHQMVDSGKGRGTNAPTNGEPADDDSALAGSPPESPAAGYLTFAAFLLGGSLLALLLAGASPLGGMGDELALLAAVLLGIVLFARAAMLVRERSDGRVRSGPPVLAALGMRIAVGFAPIMCLTFLNGWTFFLALVFTVIPGVPLAARYGFVAERACLTQIHRRLHHRGTDDLIKGELGDLFVRLCGIGLFFGLMWMVLFFTIDILCSLLFQADVLIGRMGELDVSGERFWTFLVTDPLLLTIATATALLAYPVARLAWFLCYIDLRVRRDCWDLELSLSQEAARLKETA